MTADLEADMAINSAETGAIEPDAELVAAVTERADEVWQRIEQAGGSRDSVTVVAVTKTFPTGHIAAAVAAGLVDVGENYAQDLAAKADAVAAGGIDCRMHFIGGLQRNKVKLMAGKVWLWQTVDRQALIDQIAKRDAGARILIQVNTTGEAQKSGCQPPETASLIDSARQAGLVVAGLMTVGPTGGADPRPAFEALRSLGQANEVDELSMGMSADYELAVAEGSTMVRIGSALFGPRTTR